MSEGKKFGVSQLAFCRHCFSTCPPRAPTLSRVSTLSLKKRSGRNLFHEPTPTPDPFLPLPLPQVHLCEAEKCPSPERDDEQRDGDGGDEEDGGGGGGGGSRLRVLVRSIWKGAAEGER